jgi:hypothetical protein
MEQVKLYLYLIMVFGSLALLQFILLMICKKPVWVKLQSMYFRKKGFIKIDHTDSKKTKGTYFTNVSDADTIEFVKNDGIGQLMGIDRTHIYLDNTYDIMSISTNPVGSYLYIGLIRVCNDCGFEGFQGNKCYKCKSPNYKDKPMAQQSFLSPSLADRLYKQQAMSPDVENKMEFWLKIILICAIGAVAVGLVNALMTYDIYNKMKEMFPIVKDQLVEYMKKVLA